MTSNIEKIIESLLEKEQIINNFSAPKFIKIGDSFGLIKFLKRVLLNYKEKNYNLINLLRSEEVAIFNKYFDKNSFKNINLNTSSFNSSNNLHINNTNSNSSVQHHNNEKDFSIINKKHKVITVLEQDINHTKDHFNKNNHTFYNYLDRLKKITNDVKKLNEAKLFKTNNLNNHFSKNPTNKEESFHTYKYVRHNSKFASSNIKNNNIFDTGYKSSINTPNKNSNSHSKVYTNEHKTVYGGLQSNLDKTNYQQSFDNFTNKQHNLYNDFISGLNGKIDNLVKTLTTNFEEITTKLSKFSSNNNQATDEFLKSAFKDLSSNISDIKNLCDLNGLDIDNLNDSLNKINFNELIKLLKEININIHKLINKQEKLNQDEIEVSNEIKSLESHLKAYNKEQLDILIKQINVLEKKQSEYTLTQVENRDFIVNEIKNISNILKSTSNPTLELQERLNNILNKQENLFQEAINIKNYIVSNKKDNVVEDNKSEKGLNVLIEEIKSNNNVVKEQNVFNEKIHKDMEIIKKSIIKLIDEQAKENNKASNIAVGKSLKENLQKQDNKLSLNKANLLNNENIGNDSEYNIKKVSQEVNTNKGLHKSNQVKMAIGKLKEALDLDSIHTIKELPTEYIDEIIEEKINVKRGPEKVQNNSVTSSNISDLTQNNANDSELKSEVQETNKKKQSTFVLDNSKFFK